MVTAPVAIRRPLERRLGGLVVLALAAVLAISAGWYFSGPLDAVGQPPFATVLEFLWVWLPVGGLFAGGYWLTTDEFDRREAIDVAGWSVTGTLALTALLLLILLHQQSNGATISDPFLVFLAMASGGATLGLLLGVYTVRLDRRASELEVSRERFQFLNSFLRHEIVNRISVIRGYAIQGREGDGDDRDEAFEVVETQADEIADLIDRARIVSRAVENDEPLEPIDLTAILRECVETVSGNHPDARIEASIPEESVLVRADELADAVFKNLLNNAIEHNDADEPRVRVDLERRDGDVHVRVSDNGPGIPPDVREGLFDRGDASANHGLGLYIIDTLVRRYDGSVRIADDDEPGTTFVVSLPVTSRLEP